MTMELAKSTVTSVALIEMLSNELLASIADQLKTTTVVYISDDNRKIKAKDEYLDALKDLASLCLVNHRFRTVYQRELFRYSGWANGDYREFNVRSFPVTKYPSVTRIVSRESYICEEDEKSEMPPIRDAMSVAIFSDREDIFNKAIDLAPDMVSTDHLSLAIRIKRDHFAVRLEGMPAVQTSLRKLNTMIKKDLDQHGYKKGSRDDDGVICLYRHPAFATVARGDAAGALALLGDDPPLTPYFGETYATDMTLVDLAIREGHFHCIKTLMDAAERVGDGGCHRQRMQNLVWAAVFNAHWSGPRAQAMVEELARLFPKHYRPESMLKLTAKAGNTYMFEYFVREMVRQREEKREKGQRLPMAGSRWCNRLLDAAMEGISKYIVRRVLDMYLQPGKYGFAQRRRYSQDEMLIFVQQYFEMEGHEPLLDSGLVEAGMSADLGKARVKLLKAMESMRFGGLSPGMVPGKEMVTALVWTLSRAGNPLSCMTLCYVETSGYVKDDYELACAAMRWRNATPATAGIDDP